MFQRDSVGGTFTVAAILCVVCSIIVSLTAVGLRPIKEENEQLAFQREVLTVLGLYNRDENSAEEIPELFKQVKPLLVNIDEGKVAETDEVDAETFNLQEVSANPELMVDIPSEKDVAGIGAREKFTKIYVLTNSSGKIDQIVLPVRGKGLWSTMWGLLSLDGDGKTVRGLTFYADGETPGLGGEINNPRWKAAWSNPECPKVLYNEQGEVTISMFKGGVTCETPNAEHRFEALGGATITTRGVESMMHYWLGEHGYKPLIKNMTSGELQVAAASN
ncbi:Na(+)-translocating NADH-quinone reductase subunit C [Rubinisphaera margarita]|uniref:Na(+)-translocating NADH-quinone reductase subunit C n=1 Tax=Rubinisphaera margarita TaxID=2909586 RepID=UPI001EE8F07A|nr:Na(+)-translocating NADH-quinone reductase subunit C [Rubinisphaera margarita]MCG6155616.1 Na(+)-translocating NADH-quinone reductase subunit C [Rubinisphaera margarita]